MDPNAILVKTDKGQQELKDRSAGLSQAVRTVLIMVDGHTSLASFRHKNQALPHAEEHLDWLIQEGYVEAAEGGDAPLSGFSPSVLAANTGTISGQKQLLMELARKLLGNQANKVLQKLEEAQDTPAELAAAVDRCHKLIKLTIDEDKAARFQRHGQDILGRSS